MLPVSESATLALGGASAAFVTTVLCAAGRLAAKALPAPSTPPAADTAATSAPVAASAQGLALRPVHRLVSAVAMLSCSSFLGAR